MDFLYYNDYFIYTRDYVSIIGSDLIIKYQDSRSVPPSEWSLYAVFSLFPLHLFRVAILIFFQFCTGCLNWKIHKVKKNIQVSKKPNLPFVYITIFIIQTLLESWENDKICLTTSEYLESMTVLWCRWFCKEFSSSLWAGGNVRIACNDLNKSVKSPALMLWIMKDIISGANLSQWAVDAMIIGLLALLNLSPTVLATAVWGSSKYPWSKK